MGPNEPGPCRRRLTDTMRVSRALPFRVVLLVAVLAGMPVGPVGSASSNPDTVRLGPLPDNVLEVCRRAQAERSLELLCPALLPRATVGYPGQPPNPLTARVLFDGRRAVGIEFAYGAPYETKQWRNHPRRFLHLAIFRGDSSYTQPPHGSTRLGRRRLAGRTGLLHHAPPYFRGGGYHGNHLIFRWRNGETPYTASLHSWRRDDALRLLEEVLNNLSPVALLPSPEPRRSPSGIVRVRIGSQPSGLAVTDRLLWVSRYLPKGRVARIDLQEGEVMGEPIGVGRYPYRGIAADENDVWIVSEADSVTRIDAQTGSLVTKHIRVGETPLALAIGSRYVWVVNYGDGSLSRIDPHTNRIVGGPVPVGRGPSNVSVAEGSVWVTDFDAGLVVRVNEATGEVIARIPAGSGLSDIAATPDAVWVTDFDDDVLRRIDPVTNRVVATVPVGPAPASVAVQDDSVWVVDYWDGTARRIDANANQQTDSVSIGGTLWQSVASDQHLWVLDQTGPIVGIPFRVTPTRTDGSDRGNWPFWSAGIGLLLMMLGLAWLVQLGKSLSERFGPRPGSHL
jgi:YVTN family beta-propeller protein